VANKEGDVLNLKPGSNPTGTPRKSKELLIFLKKRSFSERTTLILENFREKSDILLQNIFGPREPLGRNSNYAGFARVVFGKS